MTSASASAPRRPVGARGPVLGVAFDLDGTLVDSAADIARAVNIMLASHGLPPQTVPYVARFIGEGPRELLAGVYRGIGVEVDAERLAADTVLYLRHYAADPVVESTLYHDALPALNGLRERGVRLAVCTNKTQRMAEEVLRSLGLAEYFDVVVGGDVLPVRKPHPTHLLETLSQLGVESRSALFVGDTAHDADCARAAGVECLLVEWAAPGCGGLPEPRRVRCFTDIVDIVDDRKPFPSFM